MARLHSVAPSWEQVLGLNLWSAWPSMTMINGL